MIYREENKIFAFVNLLLLLALTAACSNVEIVSHTVTAECLSKESCANIMRSMQNHHMKLGWGDIGYNFVIGGDGRVYEGVGWTREGIHTYGWNKKSYGIAFIGNFMKAKPNDKMLKAARSLIVCGVQK
ncbi:peptidoglycan-recognition protein 1, partial [Caerostris extrusa]